MQILTIGFMCLILLYLALNNYFLRKVGNFDGDSSLFMLGYRKLCLCMVKYYYLLADLMAFFRIKILVYYMECICFWRAALIWAVDF